MTVYKLVSEMKTVLQVILSDKNNNIQGVFRHIQAKRLSKQEINCKVFILHAWYMHALELLKFMTCISFWTRQPLWYVEINE